MIPFFSSCVNWIVKCLREDFVCRKDELHLSCKRKWNESQQGLSRKTHASAQKPLLRFLTACLETIYSFLKRCLKLLCSYSVTQVMACPLTGIFANSPLPAGFSAFLPFFPPLWNLCWTKNHKKSRYSQTATFNLWMTILQIISLWKEKISIWL